MMNWIKISDESQIEEIKKKSFSRPQLIFKHSIRCGTSQLIKSRLERNEQPGNIDCYFLDLINLRSISNYIATTFKIDHQSPQVLLIHKGECIYDESHLSISMDDILEQSAMI